MTELAFKFLVHALWKRKEYYVKEKDKIVRAFCGK
jgi:hypothetical protein